MDADLLAAYLRPCPTCGSVAAEYCRAVRGSRAYLSTIHEARKVPTKAEQQAAKQAAYTARYVARKAGRKAT